MNPADTQAVTLSGQALSATGEAIGKLHVIAADARDIRKQYRASSDDAGRFTIELPCGYYDLLYFDETHTPLILAGTCIDRDLAKDIVRPVAAAPDNRIRGVLSSPNGAPAAGYSIELHDGSASNCLASAVTDRDGSFEFTDCACGYYLLSIRDASGQAQLVPLPKMAQSIEANVRLMDQRPREHVVLATEPAIASAPGQSFTVCRDGADNKLFSGGLLVPNGGPLSANALPFSVNVYVTSLGPWYFATVDGRAQSTPFGPASGPAGQYWFTDETGDTYWLVAELPYLHTVYYFSSRPNIIRIQFNPGSSGAWKDWESAPSCFATST